MSKVEDKEVNTKTQFNAGNTQLRHQYDPTNFSIFRPSTNLIFLYIFVGSIVAILLLELSGRGLSDGPFDDLDFVVGLGLYIGFFGWIITGIKYLLSSEDAINPTQNYLKWDHIHKTTKKTVLYPNVVVFGALIINSIAGFLDIITLEQYNRNFEIYIGPGVVISIFGTFILLIYLWIAHIRFNKWKKICHEETPQYFQPSQLAFSNQRYQTTDPQHFQHSQASHPQFCSNCGYKLDGPFCRQCGNDSHI